MTSESKAGLIAAGIKVDEALERFMGNESLLERFVKKFLNDPNYEKLLAAIETKDADAAFAAAHTLKGVGGNLAMESLVVPVSEQVEYLRAGQWEEAVAVLPRITEAYTKIKEAIEKL